MAVIGLKYKGAGAYRPGLPAHDMDAADIGSISSRQKRGPDELIAEAVSSGLYSVIDDEPEPQPVAEPEPDPSDSPESTTEVSPEPDGTQDAPAPAKKTKKAS